MRDNSDTFIFIDYEEALMLRREEEWKKWKESEKGKSFIEGMKALHKEIKDRVSKRTPILRQEEGSVNVKIIKSRGANNPLKSIFAYGYGDSIKK